MTREQQRLTSEPVDVAESKWFYIFRRTCSFHDGKENQHVHDIKLKDILKAITQRGLLDEWDAKRLTWKKKKATP